MVSLSHWRLLLLIAATSSASSKDFRPVKASPKLSEPKQLRRLGSSKSKGKGKGGSDNDPEFDLDPEGTEGGPDVPASPTTSNTPSISQSTSPSASPVPSSTPSSHPTLTASSNPSGTPTVSSSSAPTSTSSTSPTASKSLSPSVASSSSPTSLSSNAPSRAGSQHPSTMSSNGPTAKATPATSEVLSTIPSDGPSLMPSREPSMIPSDEPSLVPSMPSTSTTPPKVEGTDGVWTCANNAIAEGSTLNMVVQVDFVYQLWVENTITVESVSGEVERQMTEVVAKRLLTCNRRLRRLLEGVTSVSTSPPDEVSGTCDTDCHLVDGYMTIGSSEQQSSSVVAEIFCAVLDIVQDPAVFTNIATSVDGVEALLYTGSTMSCSNNETSSAGEGASAATEDESSNISSAPATRASPFSASIGLVAVGAVMFLLLFGIIARRRRTRSQQEDDATKENYEIGQTDTMISAPSHERDLLMAHDHVVGGVVYHEPKWPDDEEEISFGEDTTCDIKTSLDGSLTIAHTQAPPKPLPPVSDGEISDDDTESSLSKQEDSEMEDSLSDTNDGIPNSSSLLGAEAPDSPPISVGSLGNDEEGDDDDQDLDTMIEDAEPVDLPSMVCPPQQRQSFGSSYRRFSGGAPAMSPIQENEVSEGLRPTPPSLLFSIQSDSSVSTDEEGPNDVAQFVDGDVELLQLGELERRNSSDSEGSI